MKSSMRIVRTQPTISHSSGDNHPTTRRQVVLIVDPCVFGSAWSLTGKSSFGRSGMDLARPKKLVSGDGVDGDRNSEERCFDHGNFRRTVADEQKEHPGQEYHRVAIRKFPASRISVHPKRKGQQSDCEPNGHFVKTAFAKNQNEEGAGQKNRTTKRKKLIQGKFGASRKPSNNILWMFQGIA